jgi:Holliday junction resolvase
MPEFVIKCEYEKFFETNIDIDADEIEDVTEFMEEFEEENEVSWAEIRTIFEFTGKPVNS